MNYTMTPRLTKFDSVNFRSRLEAKWACMFDLMGWEWQYEPMQVNGYNPDFIIYTKSKSYKTNRIIVEVKPSIFINEEYKKEVINKYSNAKSHFLLLDENPFTEYGGCIIIGFGCQYLDDNYELDDFYPIEMKSDNDIGSAYMCYDGMVFDEVDRKRFIDKKDMEYNNLKYMWKCAGNMTQFKV
jgi:hypothetical protein